MSTRHNGSHIIKSIKEIEFGILTNTDIKKMSSFNNIREEKYVNGIGITDLYYKQEPKRGGLLDLSMGASGNNLCATCQYDTQYCIGHPAHIDLADPVFNILYINYIKTILECICTQCSALLVSKENDKFKNILKIKSNRARFTKIHDLASKEKFCLNPHINCGCPVSKIKLDIKKTTSSINIFLEHEVEQRITDSKGTKVEKKKQRLDLTASYIADIFDNISDEDCIILGINAKYGRPTDMIHKVFHVPPIHVRPSLRGCFSSGTTTEDTLTHNLSHIIRGSNRIKKQQESTNENAGKYAKDHAQLLQSYVAQYYNPDLISIPKNDSTSIQYKSLVDRFKGKSGRIRGNLMGKRCDFNARTVITPDPNISINMLGVPIKIAMSLTFPEFVTVYNYDKLTKLVRNGPDVYPGANNVFKVYNDNNLSTQPIQLKHQKDTIILQYGDVVERHIQNDDIVLLNRQPTLHKHNMMAHRIQIIPDTSLLTFRLSPAVTQPYAADFDGDEMNMLVPQSIQTQTELEEIVDVKKQIITPSKSTTIYGLIQDSLIGSYNLTNPNTQISWRDAMNIMGYTTSNTPIEKNKTYTGSELFSMIIPSKITMTIGKDTYIENGILKKGRININAIGAKKKNSLIHFIWDEYGENEIQKFFDNCQKLINNYNLLDGCSTGIRDLSLSKDTIVETKKYIENITHNIDNQITYIENNPEYMDTQTFEMTIRTDLNAIRDDIANLVINSASPDNNFTSLILSGAKGNPNHMGQITGCVGFQDFEGGLMPKIYNDRTLCYFHENDDRGKSRGLCYNSYMHGLTYPELCFHTKAARLGTIIQAVKTAETGYIQRKLMKTMEDAIIKYDGTLRLGHNQIIQQVYGGNANNTILQYEYKIKMLEMDNIMLLDSYKFTDSELSKFTDFTKSENNAFYDTILSLRDLIRNNVIKSSTDYKLLNTTFMLSINLSRIMLLYLSNITKPAKHTSPKYIINKIEELLHISNTPVIKVNSSQISDLVLQDDYITKITLRAALYDALNPKFIYDKLDTKTIDEIIKKILIQFNDNMVEPGEMIGCVAAQSLGEATTQATISSFHHVGIASKAHSTRGVPRISELISAAKNAKTPRMMIYLTEEFQRSKFHAQRISQHLEKTLFHTICNKIEVYYDPKPYSKGGLIETDNISEPFYSKKISRTGCSANIVNLPWLFRIFIDKEKMLTKNITLLDIKSKFCSWWEKKIFNSKKKKEKTSLLKKITSFAMMSNNDNDDQPFIHIRFNVKDITNDKKHNSSFSRTTLYEFIDLIEKFKLKGINNIESNNIIEPTRYVNINNKGGIETFEEQCIYTSGVNLQQIRYIKDVDQTRINTDDITEIFKTFGIEFARNKLVSELLAANEDAGNNGINPQHISVLADIMCYGGSVVSADRHGMKNSVIDPLTKASFEKPIETLIAASVFGDVDKMRGVSSRLYVGSVFKGGTGYCDLILDTNMIVNSEYVDKQETKENIASSSNTLANAILNDAENENDDIFIPI